MKSCTSKWCKNGVKMAYKFYTPFASKKVINTVHRAVIQLSNCSYFLPFFGVKISFF